MRRLERSSAVRVFWGRRDSVSLRAVAFAVVLFVVVTGFNYVDMAAAENVVYVNVNRGLYDVVLWRGVIAAFSHPGLVVGLAALHAYLNEGFLPALLLALAPTVGMDFWVYAGQFPEPYVLIPRPLVGYWGWVLSDRWIVARFGTLGFLVGLLARYIQIEVLDRPEQV